jgi:2-C-methyl-D-erythritol 4-phosphate cytidylyltransferase/2-C-methyl-D-erythritol 2,4-cyclodiphosphate synthase
MSLERSFALIVAAGRVTRLGGDVPKQYRLVGGRSVLRLAIERSLASGAFAGIAVVIGDGVRALYDAATAGLDLLPPILGGATRRQSVLNGLEALAAHQPELVSIQDAARPLVDAELLRRLIKQARSVGGAIAALKVVDTLKHPGDAGGLQTVSREGLWQAQTPQVFRFAAILDAHRRAAGLPAVERDVLTDDAQVASLAGLHVALVQGSAENFKITTDEDLHRLERMLDHPPQSKIRVGTGFDVHAFGDGAQVMLCGVAIAHDRGLVGHSDADVGLHALTDALLGAIGFGDIGQHFPPSDTRWRGAASRQFVEHAARHVRDRAGRIVNVDVTLICEQPRIGPHRQAMIAALADMLRIDPERVSVKATTTERLGFTGRGEGIAAQAVVSLELPGGRP